MSDNRRTRIAIAFARHPLSAHREISLNTSKSSATGAARRQFYSSPKIGNAHNNLPTVDTSLATPGLNKYQIYKVRRMKKDDIFFFTYDADTQFHSNAIRVGPFGRRLWNDIDLRVQTQEGCSHTASVALPTIVQRVRESYYKELDQTFYIGKRVNVGDCFKLSLSLTHTVQ
jgi:hypothetical protein